MNTRTLVNYALVDKDNAIPDIFGMGAFLFSLSLLLPLRG
jgi:hypothetical protein